MQEPLYDAIIIGASKEGIGVYNSMKRLMPDKHVVVISRDFDKVKIKHSVLKADRIVGEVVFTDDRRGIITAILEDRRRVSGLAMFIATGTKPIKLDLDTNRIFYKVKEIHSTAKIAPAAVLGHDERCVDAALKLSKKFRKVYVCSDEGALEGPEDKLAELAKRENVTVLPFCNAKSCRKNKKGELMSITLDTYATIDCSYVFASVGREPDVDGISWKMVRKDPQGRIMVNDDLETGIVPFVYALGSCTDREPRPKDATKAVTSYREKLGGSKKC